MKKHVVSLLFLPLITFSSTVVAGAAEQRLEQFFKQVKSMRADFTQSVVSENRRNPEKSEGVLQMQRPGKFRWEYRVPYEQQIIADGRKLWIYDVEMEQVIVKNLDLALGDTPAVLLSGDTNIADKFEIKEITDEVQKESSLYWLQLVPKKEETNFEKLLLAFAGENLQIMELKDAFGQITRLTFSNLEQNPVIDASVFTFEPPPGVDVINETGESRQK
ncbi:outer membrane lipoprotein chaperone LolA [Kaarinaea lacus]